MAISVAVETISDRVATLVTLSGLSAAELGRRAGLSRATVASITSERNEEPETKTLRLIAECTGAKLSWLLDGEGRPPSTRRVRARVKAAAAAGAGKAA